MKYVLKSVAPRPAPFDLIRDLNPQQRAVVEAPIGELLVLAGAGTGKTRTLTYRVARLVASGIHPERILLVTFTNRAAREMTARVESILGIEMRRASAGTFHHIGNRILRRYGHALGLPPSFGILDPEDARTVLAGVIAEQGLAALSSRRFPSPRILSELISLAQGTRCPLPAVIERHRLQFLSQAPMIAAVAEAYAARKREMGLVDFDDLLGLWARLLEDPELSAIASELRGSYDHVLVDEYQDINALQGALCDLMAADHGSLTCVGDDAQSIYSFRGADITQITDFTRRHPKASILQLTVNYRSTPEILALANRSIAHNRGQHRKALRAVKGPGAVPALIPVRDVYQQAEFVAQRVLEVHHEQNLPLSRIAVLYRNHSHSLELQVELTRRQIPFTIRSGLRFFEQAHIKDVVAYLRAHQNPRDSLAWIRLLRLWPGVGSKTAEEVAQALAAAPPGAAIAGLLEGEGKGRRGRARGALASLAELWRLLDDRELANPGAAIRALVDRHYAAYAERTFNNAAVRREDLEQLAAYAERFVDADEFLSELALLQGITAEAILGAHDPDDMLVLSTIHQAKGLEWPIAFVLWLSDGRFPMAAALRQPKDEEEERRLFYVAATRAADELYLCFPMIEESREGPRKILRPSRFVTELDRAPAVFERWEIAEEPLADGE